MSVNVSGDLSALPAAVEVAAYRITVEAVTNTVRHASARRCDVSLAVTPTGLAVTVTDDGTGVRAGGDHGSGLAIMRERAEELGGAVTVTTTSPGVVVAARLPVLTAPAQASPVPAVPA